MSIGNSDKRIGNDPDAATGESSSGPAGAQDKNSLDPRKRSGRVQFDDRGNAVWEWAIKTGSFGREVSTERMKRLENPGLSLAEDAPTPFDKVKPNPQGTVKGYNPYDSGKLAKTGAPPKKKTDLRKLSDWLKLKKQATNNNPDDDQS
jgi:hypothetical protein